VVEGKSAREQLVAIAERLFAERGIEAVSLREIGAAAGQRNNSAAQYHFGSREGLVDAIFETRMAPIDRRRQAMVAELEESGRTADVRALSEAFVLPLASALGDQDGRSWYARFLAQVAFDPDFELFSDRRLPVTAGLRRVIALLDAALDLPPVLRTQRLELAAGLVVHGLADRERALQATRSRSAPASPPVLLAADLVDTMVGVLTAPVSAATREALNASTRRESRPSARRAPRPPVQRPA
jgi:AcrR family transcriptional regulator